MSNSTVILTTSTPSTTPLPVTSTTPTAPSTVFETTTSFSTLTPPSPTAPTSIPVPVTTPVSTIPPPSVTPVSSAVLFTSVQVITQTAPNNVPVVVTITSVDSSLPTPPTDSVVSSSTSSASSSTSSGAAALNISSASTGSTGGLTPTGTIAVAVVVPVVAIALIILALLFFWRRRKQRKNEEELRRKEVEEYGYNPNNDPTLPAVVGAGSQGDEVSEMRETDGAGYRGWGTAPSNRKTSTTLSSGNGAAIGMARSDSGSNPSPYMPASPTIGTAPNSDVQSGDPLVGRPTSTDSDAIGALGAAPAALGNRSDRGINRGASNASSAYSGANRSDHSGDPPPHAMSSPQSYNDAMNYDDALPQHGPYGDGSYGGGQPVIRDVQARRNTRIENPSVFPQQGNSGIAQNF
ncbi:hypothetical protein MMC19_006397 [Ptychographa xylographoides]|nr:hypothetical protein [Ptychographa xylographoides]